MIRRRLTTKQREELWQAEAQKAVDAGVGEFPVCNICGFSILPGRKFDASHDPTKPRWLGGLITGIAHEKCNRDHGAKIDLPLFARNERIRKRHMDFTRSRTPMPGGRDDKLKRKLNGLTVVRAVER